MGPRIREDNGWRVDSCFRRHGDRLCCGGTGMGPRIREDNGWGWIPASVVTGDRLCCGGTGMGPRIREDNGWGWIPASVFTGTGSLREDGDWSPHPRGQRVGVDSRFRLHWGGQAFARERHGWWEVGMGPRIREDNGWGWIHVGER